jgi:hypothetical protein
MLHLQQVSEQRVTHRVGAGNMSASQTQQAQTSIYNCRLTTMDAK